MGEKIEIYKFKVTVFMAIIAAVGFMIAKEDSFLKFINSILFNCVVAFLIIYGSIGFSINMVKLSKIEKELNECG